MPVEIMRVLDLDDEDLILDQKNLEADINIVNPFIAHLNKENDPDDEPSLNDLFETIASEGGLGQSRLDKDFSSDSVITPSVDSQVLSSIRSHLKEVSRNKNVSEHVYEVLLALESLVSKHQKITMIRDKEAKDGKLNRHLSKLLTQPF